MNEWRVFVGLRRMRIGSVPSLSTDLVNRFPLPFSWYWGLSLGPHMLGKVSVTSHQVSPWKASVLPQSVPEGRPQGLLLGIPRSLCASLIPLYKMLLHRTDLSCSKVFPTRACNLALQRPRQRNCKVQAHMGCSVSKQNT